MGESGITLQTNDGGQFLWGQGMKRLGVNLETATFGDHLNEIADKGKLDTMADQDAICLGYIYKGSTSEKEAIELADEIGDGRRSRSND